MLINKEGGIFLFNLYENIKSICDEHGISVTRLCIEVGVSRSVLSNLKNGRCATLSQTTLSKMAEYLGEPIDRLMHGIKNSSTTDEEDTLQVLKDEEKALLHSYRTMTEDQKRMMSVFIKGLKNDS